MENYLVCIGLSNECLRVVTGYEQCGHSNGYEGKCVYVGAGNSADAMIQIGTVIENASDMLGEKGGYMGNVDQPAVGRSMGW